MAFSIKKGVWPTMITPYRQNDTFDIDAIQKMVDFYCRRGCAGLFAVCQSSEMLFLSKQEKLELARAVAEANNGRVQIVASGHTATDLKTQLEEIEAMMKIDGIGAYVLVSNALDPFSQGSETLLKNFYTICETFPEISFGIYECPKPFKRLVGTTELKEMAQSGKLVFFKDTCCDNDLVRERIEATKGTALKLLNANAAFFYDSFLHGSAGYSGVMANYHPELIKWVFDHSETEPEKAKLVADLLCEFGMIELRLYPTSAKYHMNLEGIQMELLSRSADVALFNKNARQEVDSLYALERELHKQLGITNI